MPLNPCVIPNSEWEAILNALVAATAPWNGAKVHLFANPAVIAPAMLLSDLTEANFTGYAASAAVTWNAATFQPDGTAIVTGDAKQFVVGATPTVFNTIYGFYVTNGAGTALLFARTFDTPIVLSAPNQQITVLPAYPAYGTP